MLVFGGVERQGALHRRERREERMDPESKGKRRIKVCIMLPVLRIGGAEIQVLGLLRNLDSERFDVHLCTLKRGDGNMEEQARRLVTRVFDAGFRWRSALPAFLRLVSYLRRERFDVLHCHLAFADSIGRLAGRAAGVPVILTTEHGKHLWKGPFYLML